MFRTQVYLTENEKNGLLLLAQELGLHQSALIREAIDLFIQTQSNKKKKKKNILDETAGLWADRNDLPNFREIRDEFNRYIST